MHCATYIYIHIYSKMFEKIVIISRIKVPKNLSLKHNKFSNFFSNFQAIHKKIDSNNLIKSLTLTLIIYKTF